VGQLNKTSLLDAWYFKAVKFERAKQSAEGIFGQERQFIDGKKATQGEAVLQKVTYLFCDELNIDSKSL